MRKAIIAVAGVVLVTLTTSVLGTIWYLLSRPKPGIVIPTKNGDIQGIISASRDGREFDEWLGIPYAVPPLGDLRFASPTPAKTWSGVRYGSDYRPVCAQVMVLGSYSRFWGSEDCLYLNVITAYDAVDFYLINPDRDGLHLRPCIEKTDDSDAFLTKHPLDIIGSREAQRVPMIAGANTDEGLLGTTVLYKQPDRLKAFEANWASNVLRQAAIRTNLENKDEIAEKIKRFYLPKYNDLSEDARCEAYTKLMTDTSFNLPLDYLVRKQREYSTVYPYIFNRQGGPSWLLCLESWVATFRLGVCHGDELPMLFIWPGLLNLAKDDDDPDYLFSKKFVKLWTDFSKDATYLEFNGVEFEPAPKTGPLKYFHLLENASVAIPAFARRTEFLQSLGFLRPELF